MASTYRLTRELTQAERADIPEAQDLQPGDILHQFTGHTYGCIREPDIAVSITEGQGRTFFPVPRDAVEEVPAQPGDSTRGEGA